MVLGKWSNLLKAINLKNKTCVWVLEVPLIKVRYLLCKSDSLSLVLWPPSIHSCHSFKFLRLDPRLETFLWSPESEVHVIFRQPEIITKILSFRILNKHAGLAEVWSSPGHRPVLQMVLPSVAESVLLLPFWPFPPFLLPSFLSSLSLKWFS